ncbi:MAG: hypothetical protein LBM00_02315 [Deltaproteobacteria bacterium]|nr:hypothetical protein [Deltaproteobacteria bacterium]
MEAIDHNKIIKKTATAVLKPYGIKRKGQSRSFIDDNGWFIIIVEFQPHTYNKGTFLNVGVNFNWYLKDYFSFDIGYRENEFVKCVEEKEFIENVDKLCKKAVEKVLKYRDDLKTMKNSEKTISEHKFTSDELWGNYHRGVMSGLMGNIRKLNEYFDGLLNVTDNGIQWMLELKRRVNELKEIANVDANKFREKIVNIIYETRKLNKLNEMEIIAFPIFDAIK